MRDSLNPHVAFLGAPGAGKSTASKFLQREWDYHIASFAGYHPGGMRDLALRLWGSEAPHERTRLDALAAALRAVDPDVWVDALMRDIDRLDHAVNIAVDDLRMPLEWAELASRGFIFIRVIAPERQRVDRLRASGKFTTMEALSAPIQVALDDRAIYASDYTVYNEEDVSVLEAQLVDVINRERSRRA